MKVEKKSRVEEILIDIGDTLSGVLLGLGIGLPNKKCVLLGSILLVLTVLIKYYSSRGKKLTK